MTMPERPERQHDSPDTEILLRRVVDLVNAAPKMPLSSTVRLEKDELLELLHEAIQRLPDELRQARWLLRERDEYLAKVQREAEDILGAARERAERIVQRTELVREAQRLSRRILEEAQDEARRLRHEAEDYCDQKLATFEIVLERTMKTVQAGREKLRVTPLPPAQEGELGGPPAPALAGATPAGAAAAGASSAPPSPEDSGEVFFDQDLG
jgi:regulator of protease activity HflC (stomatin/prohibitin superfamily)